MSVDVLPRQSVVQQENDSVLIADTDGVIRWFDISVKKTDSMQMVDGSNTLDA